MMGSYNQNPGISDEQVEAWYGWNVDENMPCGCGHKLMLHADEDENNKCTSEGCECKQFTEFEPDMDDIDD